VPFWTKDRNSKFFTPATFFGESKGRLRKGRRGQEDQRVGINSDCRFGQKTEILNFLYRQQLSEGGAREARGSRGQEEGVQN
jgi:hypothetical protein